MQSAPALSHHALFLLLLQIVVILAVSRPLAELMKRLGQPTVLGELLAGIVLGPSLLGWIWPGGYLQLFPADVANHYLQPHLLEIVSWIGMVLLLLLTGLETDVRLLRHLGRSAFTSSALGMIVPFVSGFALGMFTPAEFLANPDRRILFSLFLATAMSISAMPVIAKILMDLELTKRNIGVVILSAGVVDDTTGWLILSLIAGLAGANAAPLQEFATTLLLTGAFLAASFLVFWPAARWLLRWADERGRSPNADLAIIVAFAFLLAAITEAIHIHAVFGAFVAGCIVRQVPSLRPATLHRLEAVVVSVFAPVFFGLVGLKVDLRTIGSLKELLIVVGVATAGKLIGCTLGGLLGKMTFWESVSIGVAMNARGAMELVVALLGLTLGILNPAMYAIIVVMAVITSFMAPLGLRLTLRRVKMTAEEEARILSESQKGLFDKSRLKALLPSAGGPNALVAARIGTALVRGETSMLSLLFVESSDARPVSAAVAPPSPRSGGQEPATASRPREDLCRRSRLASGDPARDRARSGWLHLQGGVTRLRPAAAGRRAAQPAAVAGDLAHPRRGALPRGHRARPRPGAGLPADPGLHRRQLFLPRRRRAGAGLRRAGGRRGDRALLDGGRRRCAPSTTVPGLIDSGFRRMMATTLLTTLSPLMTRTTARANVIVREGDQPTLPVLNEARTGLYQLLIVGARRTAPCSTACRSATTWSGWWRRRLAAWSWWSPRSARSLRESARVCVRARRWRRRCWRAAQAEQAPESYRPPRVPGMPQPATVQRAGRSARRRPSSPSGGSRSRRTSTSCSAIRRAGLPRIGYGAGLQVTRALVPIGRGRFGVGVDFGYDRFSHDLKASAFASGTEFVAHATFAAMAVIDGFVGRVRPWLAVGGGFSVANYENPPQASNPMGDSRVGAAGLIKVAAGLGVRVYEGFELGLHSEFDVTLSPEMVGNKNVWQPGFFTLWPGPRLSLLENFAGTAVKPKPTDSESLSVLAGLGAQLPEASNRSTSGASTFWMMMVVVTSHY